MFKNVIIAITNSPYYLDIGPGGYWITKRFENISLRFNTELEALNFINIYHKGDTNLIPTFVEWELYRKVG